jgi:23S rRNA pseudouridine1911/1915/1917 synthase
VEWRAETKERLDVFLSRQFAQSSRSKVAAHIQAGQVQVEGETVTKPGFLLKAGFVIVCKELEPTAAHDLTPVAMDLDIRFEDDHLLVVNKPRGLAVHPANSLTGATLVHGLLARGHGLSESAGAFRPGIVHRLDKETTGLILVAKSDRAHAHLSAQIQAREVERRYVAVIAGELPNPRFTIDAPLGRDPRNPLKRAVIELGKSARTHVQSIRSINEGLIVSCRLESGRTHQIRIHLAHFGWPVVGDDLYAPPKLRPGPMQLHAASLAFVHPSGSEMRFFAEPPEDFYGRDWVTSEVVEAWK